MKHTNQAWKALAALPIAIAVIISAGREWILRSWPSTEFSKNLNRPRNGRGSERPLQAQWVTVTENGKPRLRMQWSTPAIRGLGHRAA